MTARFVALTSTNARPSLTEWVLEDAVSRTRSVLSDTSRGRPPDTGPFAPYRTQFAGRQTSRPRVRRELYRISNLRVDRRGSRAPRRASGRGAVSLEQAWTTRWD